MKLATIRTEDGTRAVRVDRDRSVETGHTDVGALLAIDGWRTVAAEANGASHNTASIHLAPVVPRPEKIICVGLNFRQHITEMGREIPDHPTVFAKFARALIGANDTIRLPTVSGQVDWEAELAVVVGQTVRNATDDEAERAIAGYSILNDVTVRDYQCRTTQWLQCKTSEGTTPLGPWLVVDEAPPQRQICFSRRRRRAIRGSPGPGVRRTPDDPLSLGNHHTRPRRRHRDGHSRRGRTRPDTAALSLRRAPSSPPSSMA